MAVGTPSNIGTANTKASTTESISVISGVSAGSAIFVVLASNGGSPSITSVADTAGNSYSLLSSVAYNNVASNGSLYVYVAYNSNLLSFANSITVTAGAAQLVAASAFYVPSLPSSNIVGAVVTATGSSASPTATKTGLTVGANYLGLGFVGVQGTTADTFTQVSGWATPPNRVSSTGGNVTTNGMIEGGYDAFTAGATSITYNPTITSRPWAEILVIYTAAVVFSDSVTETATATDSPNANNSIPTQTVSETATATDTESFTFARNGDVAETAVVTETESATLSRVGAISETAAQTEALSAAGSTYNVARTETATATAVQDGSLLYLANLAEAVSAQDSVSYTLSMPVSLAEAVALQDVVLSGISSVAFLSEALALSDSLLARLFWELIDDNQVADWQNVASEQSAGWGAVPTAQTPEWSAISSAQGASWTDVDNGQTPEWTNIQT